jgi:hypothetical protein
MKNRLHTLSLASSSPNAWKKACFDTASLTPSAIYYPVELQSNRGQENRNSAYEKYFELDEVGFCVDTFNKTTSLLKILSEK